MKLSTKPFTNVLAVLAFIVGMGLSNGIALGGATVNTGAWWQAPGGNFARSAYEGDTVRAYFSAEVVGGLELVVLWHIDITTEVTPFTPGRPGTALPHDFTEHDWEWSLVSTAYAHNITDSFTATRDGHFEISVSGEIEFGDFMQINRLTHIVDQDPSVYPARLNILNVAPTFEAVSVSAINEGDIPSASIVATDPGKYDNLQVYINGSHKHAFTENQDIRSGTFAFDPGSIADDEGMYDLTFRLHDDDVYSDEAVQRTLVVNNVAPNVLDKDIPDINEGDIARLSVIASDPGVNDQLRLTLEDEEYWFLNQGDAVRSLSDIELGTYADDGLYSIDFTLDDGDGGVVPMAQSFNVLNLDPYLLGITGDLSVFPGEPFDFFAEAADAGINDTLTYLWDFDADGEYDDFVGNIGSWSFNNPGLYDIALQVSDGDGGFGYGSFNVNMVPEPSTMLLFGTGLLGLAGFRLRRKK